MSASLLHYFWKHRSTLMGLLRHLFYLMYFKLFLSEKVLIRIIHRIMPGSVGARSIDIQSQETTIYPIPGENGSCSNCDKKSNGYYK